MNKPRWARAIPLTAITAAGAVAAAVMGGGYALASSSQAAFVPRVATYTDTLHFLVGGNVSVAAGSSGVNATKCPSGSYPVGGGPSSSSALWMLQFSDADRSSSTVAQPNEWTVGLFNDSSTTQFFKVFVVCSTAQKVTSNY